MDKKEFALLAMALKTYYPKEGLLPNNQAMELWFNQLADIDYKVAETALNKWVATNKWSPSIADIREQSAEIIHGALPDWGEGWQQVKRAISRYGMYRVGEAMASFDDLTRQTVERMGGFKNICLTENGAQERANFRMIYEQLAERKRKNEQISPKILAIIQEVTPKLLE